MQVISPTRSWLGSVAWSKEFGHVRRFTIRLNASLRSLNSVMIWTILERDLPACSRNPPSPSRRASIGINHEAPPRSRCKAPHSNRANSLPPLWLSAHADTQTTERMASGGWSDSKENWSASRNQYRLRRISGEWKTLAKRDGDPALLEVHTN